MRSAVLRFCVLATLVAGAASQAHAAALTTTVFGQVVDIVNKGAPVADAIIIVTSPALQGEQTALSDDKGHYRIDQLPPGDYTIKVNAPGFKEYEVSNVKLLVGREVKVKVDMVPEVVTGQTIEVTQVITSTIDQGSATTGVTLTKDYMNRVATA